VQGQAHPIQLRPTVAIAEGSAAVGETPGGRRAVVGGYVLTVQVPGSALLQVPAGGTVTVSQVPAERPVAPPRTLVHMFSRLLVHFLPR